MQSNRPLAAGRQASRYTKVLRGIFLKGSGLDVLWPLWTEALALLGIGLPVLALASLRFRKSLE